MHVPGLATIRHHVRVATRIAPGRPASWLGLRTAVSTAVPLALAPWLGAVAATWGPLAGFGVSLVDRGGAYRTRALHMSGAALGGLVAVIVGSLVSGSGALAVGVITVGLTACALGRAWGAAGASIGNTIAVQLMVAGSIPLGPNELWLRAGGFVLGALIAMFLSLVVWPVRVYKPGRQAIAKVLTALAEHAEAITQGTPGAPGWLDGLTRRRRVLRERIELARAVLAATRRGRRGETGRGERLLAIVQLCDQIFGTLIGLEEALEAGYPSATRHTTVQALEELAVALRECAQRVLVEGPQAAPATRPWDREVTRPEPAAAHDSGTRPLVDHALLVIELLRGDLRLVSGLIDSLVDDADPIPPLMTGPLPRPPWGDRIRTVLDPAILRHALRVAAGAIVATSLVSGLQLQFGYWVTLTTYLLLQPQRAATTTRSLQRVVGTVAGGVVAAAIAWAVRDPLAVMTIVVVLAGLSASVLQLNHLLYSTLVTPTFVLLLEVHTQDFTLVGVRVANTLIGGAIAFAAGMLLWPVRERKRFGEALAEAAAAASRYIDAVVQAAAAKHPLPSPDLFEARRAFGLALNGADAALERLIAERPSTDVLEPRMTLITFMRRLGAAINVFASTRAVVAYGPHAPAITEFAREVQERLAELGTALGSGTAPTLWPRVVPEGVGTVLGTRLARIDVQLSVLAEAAMRAATSNVRAPGRISRVLFSLRPARSRP